jgi:hypothetical protein
VKTKNETALTGLWALLWRSVVYVPLGFAVCVLLVCIIAALVFPPIIGAMFLCHGLWWQGVAAFAGWVLPITVWRYFHLGRFFAL